ncbi:cobalt ABC transporter permease [Actinoplanes sp. SE50]|uniref:cobalt ECF transporter T component CbiQ n=1 Tax=unclassified Actinoplanes TaxID=2626549 RepID=UPI00023ED203|nr:MULTISPECIES: cobalt ECF transporter T component CbiQ [unclassified Actinoplanes]AEV83335.1 uncharacterized protein ACPL_2440 [Actinoplanes sp. SE50/110]ATO81728.1 cobalt ABC transporter permease [Actinoplanes sp. SE50]SLL99136.1 cobalt ECF transporter T component CbiQ [Actinoplanes sp. SE50/110]
MGAGHSHPLYLDRRGPLHRLAPEVKIVAALLFTVVVVVTPPTLYAAFLGYLLLVALLAAAARVPVGWLAKRASIELPFVLLALALPVLGHGARVTWLGLSLSVDGLHGAWNIFAKGTLGVLASLLLAATTTMRDLILGLDRLRVPSVFTQIATFMLRYIDVLADDARRMRIARLSRGYDPRFLWQVKAFAVGVGSLFLRSYERGERVYLAMVSRGYTGRMPQLTGPVAPAGQWAVSAVLPLLTAGIAVAAGVLG